jgi:hypothetical protein
VFLTHSLVSIHEFNMRIGVYNIYIYILFILCSYVYVFQNLSICIYL